MSLFYTSVTYIFMAYIFIMCVAGLLFVLHELYSLYELNFSKLAKEYEDRILEEVENSPNGITYGLLSVEVTGKIAFNKLYFKRRFIIKNWTSNYMSNQFLYSYRKLKEKGKIRVEYENGNIIVHRNLSD